MPKHAQEIAEGWIPYFSGAFDVKRHREMMGVTDPELQSELDITINNLEEDWHQRLERYGEPLIARLRAHQADVFDDPETGIGCAWFIGSRYLRTPRILARTLKATSDLPFNTGACFGLLRTISATNIGLAIWANRSIIQTSFLYAAGEATFITGDQPIINLRGIGLLMERWLPALSSTIRLSHVLQCASISMQGQDPRRLERSLVTKF